MSELVYDVIQVGYGPVSKAMAIFLSRREHKVGVFERFSEVYPLPRAVCIDHEIARAMHANGLGPQLDAVTSPAPLYRWYNAEWKELLCIDWTKESISGGPEVNFIHQPSFERSLDVVVRNSPNVALHMGWEAIDLMQSEDHVELTVREHGDARGEAGPLALSRRHRRRQQPHSRARSAPAETISDSRRIGSSSTWC